MGKKVAIIGGGVAGLSAASYLQRNGFDTTVYEMHDKPGGLCTAWNRSGFTFDGCIHWLMGSSPKSNMHELWKELGAANLTYIEWDVYTTVTLKDGQLFTVYTNPDAFEAEIVRISPEDTKFARVASNLLRKAAKVDMPAAWDKLSFGQAAGLMFNMLGSVSFFGKWSKVTVAEFSKQIKHPLLAHAFGALFSSGGQDFPASFFFLTLGFMAKKASGYPLGGSLAFAHAIEQRYLGLGGNIRYRFLVDEIVVESGRVAGIKSNGEKIESDMVIAACDLEALVHKMLPATHRPQVLENALASMQPFPSLLFIGLGLDRHFEMPASQPRNLAELAAGFAQGRFPHMTYFPLKRTVALEGGALPTSHVGLRMFSFDPSLAPEGKTAAALMIETYNYDYWSKLAASDKKEYQARKKAHAEDLISAIDEVIPGFKKIVSVIDVATPHTFFRYTNNWRGSFEGWLASISNLETKIPREFPQLPGLYLVGQWVNPGGGLPPCAIDGRNLAKKLCKKYSIKFSPD